MSEAAHPDADVTSVTFDPSEPKARRALVRTLSSDRLGAFLRIVFVTMLYVIAAWIVAVLLARGLDLDIDTRDALASVMLVVLLSIGFWQQWSRDAAALHMGIDRFSVRVKPGGLEVSSPLYDVRCDWSAVDRIEIRKDHLIVTYLKSRGIAIPTAAFGSDVALQEFLAAARSCKSGATAA